MGPINNLLDITAPPDPIIFNVKNNRHPQNYAYYYQITLFKKKLEKELLDKFSKLMTDIMAHNVQPKSS